MQTEIMRRPRPAAPLNTTSPTSVVTAAEDGNPSSSRTPPVCHKPPVPQDQSDTDGPFCCAECDAYNDQVRHMRRGLVGHASMLSGVRFSVSSALIVVAIVRSHSSTFCLQAHYSKRKGGVLCQVCGTMTHMDLAEFLRTSTELQSVRRPGPDTAPLEEAQEATDSSPVRMRETALLEEAQETTVFLPQVEMRKKSAQVSLPLHSSPLATAPRPLYPSLLLAALYPAIATVLHPELRIVQVTRAAAPGCSPRRLSVPHSPAAPALPASSTRAPAAPVLRAPLPRTPAPSVDEEEKTTAQAIGQSKPVEQVQAAATATPAADEAVKRCAQHGAAATVGEAAPQSEISSDSPTLYASAIANRLPERNKVRLRASSSAPPVGKPTGIGGKASSGAQERSPSACPVAASTPTPSPPLPHGRAAEPDIKLAPGAARPHAGSFDWGLKFAAAVCVVGIVVWFLTAGMCLPAACEEHARTHARTREHARTYTHEYIST